MKNVLTVSAFAVILGVSDNVLANPLGGGFTGPSQAAISVAEAKKLGDDAPVVLKGRIEKNLGGEKYVFTDDSGSVTVEIDNEDWNGVNVSEKDTVELRGEVDKDLMNFEIDVDSVMKK